MRGLPVLAVAVSLVIFCLAIGEPAFAVPNPSVPEFTLQYVESSRDVAPVYEFDPFTGQNVLTHYGYSVTDKTIEIKIKNQPFTPITINGTLMGLYYGIRSKPHFGDNWNEAGLPLDPPTPVWDYYQASNSDYTVISYTLSSWDGFKNGDKVDFQVRARIGYDYPVYSVYRQTDIWGYLFYDLAASAWSNTETVTIGQNTITETPTATMQPTQTPTMSSLPSQTPTATPQNPINSGSPFNLSLEQITLVIMSMVIVTLAIGMIALFRKIGKK